MYFIATRSSQVTFFVTTICLSVCLSASFSLFFVVKKLSYEFYIFHGCRFGNDLKEEENGISNHPILKRKAFSSQNQTTSNHTKKTRSLKVVIKAPCFILNYQFAFNVNSIFKKSL